MRYAIHYYFKSTYLSLTPNHNSLLIGLQTRDPPGLPPKKGNNTDEKKYYTVVERKDS